jgi:hypothetical protein
MSTHCKRCTYAHAHAHTHAHTRACTLTYTHKPTHTHNRSGIATLSGPAAAVMMVVVRMRVWEAVGPAAAATMTRGSERGEEGQLRWVCRKETAMHVGWCRHKLVQQMRQR